MRLINADELEKKLDEMYVNIEGHDFGNGERYYIYQDAIVDVQCAKDAMPTIDAVEVIRCKECKHWKKEISQFGDIFIGMCRRKAAIKSEFPCTADGFCKWAERREEQ